jgi:hypothetical protein
MKLSSPSFGKVKGSGGLKYWKAASEFAVLLFGRILAPVYYRLLV